MRNGVILFEQCESLYQSRQVPPLGWFSDVKDKWDIGSQIANSPLCNNLSRSDRPKQSCVDTVRDDMNSFWLHTVKPHHVAFAVLADCRHNACPSGTHRVDRSSLISSPPIKSVWITFI